MSTRRRFLQSTLAAGVAAAADPLRVFAQAADKPAPAAAAPQAFRFVHLTDIHVEPERNAAKGMAAALKAVEALKPRPDFILTGGDLVFDIFEAGPDRAKMLFDLYKKILADNTSLPVHHTVGNHDVFGWSGKNGVTPQTPGYGKAMVGDSLHMPQTYYSFDHKGWRFIVLDNIQHGEDKYGYTGRLDGRQRDWLAAELKKTDPRTPIVTCEHIPVVSATVFAEKDSVKNGKWEFGGGRVCSDAPDRLQLYADRNVRLCLSGHIHQLDRVEFRGTTFICDGAVSGAWWRGPHRGFEEGFGLLDLHPDGRFEHRYHDYCWQVKE